MNKHSNYTNEWNIAAYIGPILFNILIDTAFFNYSTHQSSERHSHAAYEFHFITEGSGLLYADDMQYEVAANNYYLIRSGVYHLHKVSSSNPIHRYSFKFEFDICSNNFNSYSEEEIKNFVYILSNTRFFYSQNFDSLKQIILEIQSELKQKAIGYYTKVQHLFSLLFISILREIGLESRHEINKRVPEKYQENRLNVIENFFDLNYYYKATSKDLCGLLHLSSSQLNRILKEKYNMTFKQKHMETQIEHAKDMLINTNLPIKAVAEKTGYTTEGNFTAFFKHMLGICPKEYRKLYQNENKI